MSSATLGISPPTAKRTWAFPDLSMVSIFGWSGAGWTEDVTVEQGGKDDISGLITTETYGVSYLHFTKNIRSGGLPPFRLPDSLDARMMWTYCDHMKSATLRDLRNNFTKLEHWLREGEEIEIFRRQKLVAVLTKPPRPKGADTEKLPDFARRRKSMGLSVLSANDLQRIQEFEGEGQEG